MNTTTEKRDRSEWSQIVLNRDRVDADIVNLVNSTAEENGVAPTRALIMLLKREAKRQSQKK